MRQFLIQFVGGAVGAGVATAVLLLTIRLPRFDLGLVEGLVLLFAALPILFLIVAIHELGHLVAGAVVRFRPCLLIVGPLKLERPRLEGGWRPGVNRCFPLFGGFAGGIPDSVEDLRRRIAILVAGGPGASLLTGLLAYAALVAMRAPAGMRPTLAGGTAVGYLVLLLFCVLSLLVALSALIPSAVAGHSSDGTQLLRYFRNDADAEADAALTAVSLGSLAGQRPRDWDDALVRRALTLPHDTARGVIARLIAHSYALDRGDLPTARAYLLEALAHRDAMPAMSRPSLLLQAAYFTAIHDGDAALAREYFDAAGQGALVSEESRQMAEAAVLHVEGKPGVDALLDRAEAGLNGAMDRGGAKMSHDNIAALRERRGVSACRG